MMKTILLCASLVLLTGCAGQQPEGLRQLFATASCSKPDADQQLSLNLADEMLNDGRPHASLAHLQQLPDTFEQVRLRKAKVSRLLGLSEAEPLYRSLLGGCWPPKANMALANWPRPGATTSRPCRTSSGQ